jgi:hypothetical protein
VDLHPEDVLDRARRGAASPEELARLRAHLAECHACRFEHVLADDCARAAGPEPGAPASESDGEVLARVRREASRAVRARDTARHARGRRRPPPLVFAAAAVLMFAATFAAATTIVRRVWRGPSIEPIASAPVASRPHRRVASSRAHAEAVATVEDEAVDPADALDEGLAAAVEESRAPAPPVRAARPRQAAPTETPAELFARANAARRDGRTREAARLYRELQRAHPGTSEELVSRVTLGRWMLDRLNDPAGALVRFDSYLANPVHTALREEALIGRALALGRLGREREERSAWTAFLAAFPGSVYAERARGRLEALR